MTKYFIKTKYNESLLSPNGLSGLKLIIERSDSNSFYRQKLTGSLEFTGKDYKNIAHLEEKCCEEVVFDIYRDCNGNQSLFSKAKVQSNAFEWDFDLCTAKLQGVNIIDLYFGVYKFYEKKVNMCAIVRNQKVKYVYRKEVSENVNQYLQVSNNCGNYFIDWLFFAVKATFLGTEYESLIPANASNLSTFINLPFNPCTGRRNTLAFAIIAQASDFISPTSIPATGLTNIGLLSDSLALSLKDLLETLESTFDLKWFINDVGKFQIEHLSYFENNLSYQQNSTFGLDLTKTKYSKFVKGYSYSYKNDVSDFYGIEELKLTLNEATFKSAKAVEGYLFELPDGTIEGQDTYYFSKVSDFEMGNIKFTEGCIQYDEKGEVKKKTRASSIFITAIEPARLGDETVDKTKWVLMDCKKESEFSNIHLIQKANCERISQRVINGNLSATAIMRDFLRYKKPYSEGLMSYSEKPTAEIGKGYLRPMYSAIASKKLKRISIPYCCDDEQINTSLQVKLPDGSFCFLEKAEYEFSSEMINLDLSKVSACAGNIYFPDLTTGESFPPVRTILKTETIEIQIGYDTICDDYGCYPQPIYGTLTRTTFADGEGGSYYEDA